MYIWTARPSCFSFDMHDVACAAALARVNTGNNIAAKIAIIAITTSSSINVKARFIKQVSRVPSS